MINTKATIPKIIKYQKCFRNSLKLIRILVSRGRETPEVTYISIKVGITDVVRKKTTKVHTIERIIG